MQAAFARERHETRLLYDLKANEIYDPIRVRARRTMKCRAMYKYRNCEACNLHERRAWQSPCDAIPVSERIHIQLHPSYRGVRTNATIMFPSLSLSARAHFQMTNYPSVIQKCTSMNSSFFPTSSVPRREGRHPDSYNTIRVPVLVARLLPRARVHVIALDARARGRGRRDN